MTARGIAFFALTALVSALPTMANPKVEPNQDSTQFDTALPNDGLRRPVAEQIPMVFVSRGVNKAEWQKLPRYFNETTEHAFDPTTGKFVDQKVIKIRLPLGINVAPTIPGENPMTLQRWELGKKLYFDPILSSDNTVSCATCHSPDKGFSDGSRTSTGISGKLGGMNAPTVLNSAFNKFQFWDGRAASLEHQAQGPVGNSVEMFAGTPEDAWHAAVKRIRNSKSYAGAFEKEFGHLATRDAVAKAIATYERTVIVGNSIQDRAEVAARVRAEEEEINKFEPIPNDYEKVLSAAFANKDSYALTSVGINPDKGADRIPEVARSISNGRVLFFGKARCNNCHVGESYTDHTFHNLGVGTDKGKVLPGQEGRYAALPLGAKDPALYGAFKTPQLRGLLGSRPYMHTGDEKTLEDVIEYYDKGGNANPYLDAKMRDTDAEKAFVASKNGGAKFVGPTPTVFTTGGWPIIPKKLELAPQEKKDLVMFMRALEGDPVDSVLANVK